MHRLFLSLLVLASLCLIVSVAQAATPRVGVLYPAEAGEASLQTRSETVYSGTRVIRSATGGMLHLDNDQVIQMSPNSAAIFELRGDSVAVRVLAGRLRCVGEAGHVLVAGSGSRFTLAPTESYPDEAEALLLRQPFDRRNPRPGDSEAESGQRSSKSAISGR
jgi:hypothetical protein